MVVFAYALKIRYTARMHKPSRSTTTQILRFGVVGVLNTAIDAMVYVVLQNSNPFFVRHFLFASLIAFGVATLNSFFWNKHWTFKHGSAYSHKQLVTFYFLASVALCVNQVVLYVATHSGFEGVAGKLIASATASVVSFLMQKKGLFKTSRSVE